MSNIFETRKKSLFSPESGLESLAHFDNFPIFIGATDASLDTDIHESMDWDICLKTGCIQLRSPINPNLIYSGFHSEAIGETWDRHHLKLIDFTKKFVGQSILEIGGSNAAIADKLLNEFSNITDYTIIEPNPNCESSERLQVIDKFFDCDYAIKTGDKFDLCLHSHTLEHAYDPLNFIKGTSHCTKDGGYQIISVPNLKKYMQLGFTNCLNFEHTYFLTPDLLIAIMSHYGFELIETYDFEDHSLFFAFRKNLLVKKINLPNNYTQHKNLFTQYLSQRKNDVRRINKQIEKYEQNIFLFGAHVFSQYLINFGLNNTRIKVLIDNSRVKNGKRLYGTNLKIEYPKVIEHEEKPVVILKAGQYQNEVRAQLMNLNPEVIIIE